MADSNRSGLPTNRVALVGLGVLLGALWGVVMWAITVATGDEAGITGLLYIIITMAMIGGGVAAIFGAISARRRGEQIAPEFKRGRRKD